MSQEQKTKTSTKVEEVEETVEAKDVQNEELEQDVLDVLDEIDDVLEQNAEEFVNQYVQKGGE